MDTNNFTEMHMRMEEAHAKYRSSGFGLAATILSLSAGGIAAILSDKSGLPRWMALVLYLPVSSGILQQYCVYMGQRRNAEASDEQLDVFIRLEMKIIQSVAATKDAPGPLDTAFKKQAQSKCWYWWADRLCAFSVISFCILLLGCLSYLTAVQGPQ